MFILLAHCAESETGDVACPGATLKRLLVFTGDDRLDRNRLGLDNDEFFLCGLCASPDKGHKANCEDALDTVRHVCLLSLLSTQTEDIGKYAPVRPNGEVKVTLV